MNALILNDIKTFTFLQVIESNIILPEILSRKLSLKK
jgi:hypothetical protein